MNTADILGISIFIIFISTGYFMGTIRSIASMLGVIFASKIVDQMFLNHASQSAYILAFLGIFIGFTVVGMIIYGRSRITLVESMEGVFGAIAGLVIGWGVARFAYSVSVLYNPTGEFCSLIAMGMIARDIYNITPLAFMIDSTYSLRNPKF